MKIERSLVTKLVLRDLSEYRLDPVTVLLEDLGATPVPLDDKPDYISRKGKVIIECYGKSWTAYWGGMGDCSVSQFIQGCDDAYLVNCLDRSISSSRFTGAALVDKARAVIIERRRGRSLNNHSLNREEARRLYDEASDFAGADNLDQAYACNGGLLHALFGDEWWQEACRATEENPDYQYLTRIVRAVRDGLRQAQQER